MVCSSIGQFYRGDRHSKQPFGGGICEKPSWLGQLRHPGIVLGPYVVDEQGPEDGGYVHLDILEVRHGKIVHEWESDDYSSWSKVPAGR